MDEKTIHNNELDNTSDEHNETNAHDNTITIDDVLSTEERTLPISQVALGLSFPSEQNFLPFEFAARRGLLLVFFPFIILWTTVSDSCRWSLTGKRCGVSIIVHRLSTPNKGSFQLPALYFNHQQGNTVIFSWG